MKFGMFLSEFGWRACVRDGADVVDVGQLLDGLEPHDDSACPPRALAPEGLARLRRAARDGQLRSLPRYPMDSVRLGPPVSAPGKILVAARNYASHAAESVSLRGGEPVEGRPPRPLGYLKCRSSLTGPGDDVPMVRGSSAMDYEVHVVAVIGSTARDVGSGAALNHVVGLTLANNLNPRDLVLEELGDFGIMTSMSFEGRTPLGPFVTTLDEFADPDGIGLRCRVDGDLRQDDATSSLLFSIAELVSHFSRIGLHPGDLIFTGTPAGIAAARKPDPGPWYLRAGAIVESEADGIGRLVNRITEPPQNRREDVQRGA